MGKAKELAELANNLTVSGGAVTVSGFNVGSIQDISFYKNTMDILVKFRVENKVKFSKNILFLSRFT